MTDRAFLYCLSAIFLAFTAIEVYKYINNIPV